MTPASDFCHLARRLRRITRNTLHRLLDVTCPEFCGACRNTATSELLCATCQADQMPQLTSRRSVGEVPAYAPWMYTEAVKIALHRFKFESHPELARRAARAIWQCLPRELQLPGVWVPVPLSNPRLLERGYNQAALLARELALASCSVAPRHWLRRDGIVQQSGLSRRERLTNAKTAFAPTRTAHEHTPCRVVLVDDVLTTGATALACSEALRAAGHTPIAVVTLARA